MVTPSSNIFLALSQAPPAFDWKMAINTPETVTPANKPPKASAPKTKPIITGETTANTPGITISRKAAAVEISTHLPYSATPSASWKILWSSALQSFISVSPFLRITAKAAFKGGMSANWRRTSVIMAIAARPTAPMAMAENTNGNIAPTNKQAITVAFDKSMVEICAEVIKAPNNASAVKAADAMAKPLPIAAVVFPTASNLSVR